MRKIICLFVVIVLIVVCMPIGIAYAISNPDTIEFGSGITAPYKIFYNVFETGDWWVIAEGYVNYASEPTDYTASEAFNFELLNDSGNITYAVTSLVAYGDRPISIYLTASQVTSLGLLTTEDYMLKITGVPPAFSTPTGNTINATTTATDFVDQSTSTNTTNHIRTFMINMMETIENEDSPTDDYVITSNGIKYISSAGANIVLEGIPELDDAVPSLFSVISTTIGLDTPTDNGTYSENLTQLGAWNNITRDGLTNMGVWLGINQSLAASTVYFILATLLCGYVYVKSKGKALPIILAFMLIVAGIPLGFVSMGIVFGVIAIIVILAAWYFWSRVGA